MVKGIQNWFTSASFCIVLSGVSYGAPSIVSQRSSISVTSYCCCLVYLVWLPNKSLFDAGDLTTRTAIISIASYLTWTCNPTTMESAKTGETSYLNIVHNEYSISYLSLKFLICKSQLNSLTCQQLNAEISILSETEYISLCIKLWISNNSEFRKVRFCTTVSQIQVTVMPGDSGSCSPTKLLSQVLE